MEQQISTVAAPGAVKCGQVMCSSVVTSDGTTCTCINSSVAVDHFNLKGAVAMHILSPNVRI